MTLIDPEPLNRAVDSLMADIETQCASGEALAPEKLERVARSISVQLKAMADIAAHNQRASAQDDQQRYLKYEDLPPPSPEDRAKLIARLQLLYDRVTAAQSEGEIS